jgi:hypothetical protein
LVKLFQKVFRERNPKRYFPVSRAATAARDFLQFFCEGLAKMTGFCYDGQGLQENLQARRKKQ